LNTSQNFYPAIQGLTWHRTQYYSFFLPMNWHPFVWTNGRDGKLFGPDPNDPATIFAVDLLDLGVPVTAADLAALAEGFFEGIEHLPAANIESRQQTVIGRIIHLEAQYTFQEQGMLRKRWTRLFYDETRQITMTAQGASPEKYHYWLPWFFEAMMTAKIHRHFPELPE
jgi:hypothetical protein